MQRKRSSRCRNEQCNRKFGSKENRPNTRSKIVKVGSKSSALCSVCYNNKYLKDAGKKKEYMKAYYDKTLRDPDNLLRSFLKGRT